MTFRKQHRPKDGDYGVIGLPTTSDWQLRRLSAIMEHKLTRDPWGRCSIENFHLSAKELIRRAVEFTPTAPVPTVSGFTSWLYSLYQGDPDSESLREGTEAENEILESRRDWMSYSEFRHFHFTSWHQVHCGMGSLGVGDRREIYLIPDLAVNGTPLRAVPDLVFRHEDNGAIMIIEVKFSMAIIPRNLWPNLWAQLWAYSKIPQFSSAPKIYAVGEVWGQNAGPWTNRGLNSPLYLRCSETRDPREEKYDQFFQLLFNIYAGASTQDARTAP